MHQQNQPHEGRRSIPTAITKFIIINILLTRLLDSKESKQKLIISINSTSTHLLRKSVIKLNNLEGILKKVINHYEIIIKTESQINIQRLTSHNKTGLTTTQQPTFLSCLSYNNYFGLAFTATNNHSVRNKITKRLRYTI